jgi:NAD(P)-dependent dehydrogenase (short-subunit alcohol dehydrogenase family)
MAKNPCLRERTMNESIVWISGATEGIGRALARTAPYENARIINLSRRRHPDFESVQFDLTEPATYDAVRKHFVAELASFRGSRALFIHSARYSVAPGFTFDTDSEEYCRALQANAVGPLVLGSMFLSAVGPDYESGLILMSSAAASSPIPGRATYCAGSAACEMWVRTAASELRLKKPRSWVVAVRPSVVDRQIVSSSSLAATYSGQGQAASDREHEHAAREIWSALPPRPGTSVLMFDERANLIW